jgi:hypothetical protein
MATYTKFMGNKRVAFGSGDVDTTTGTVAIDTGLGQIDVAFAFPFNNSQSALEVAYCVPNYSSTSGTLTVTGYDDAGVAATATTGTTIHYIAIGE